MTFEELSEEDGINIQLNFIIWLKVLAIAQLEDNRYYICMIKNLQNKFCETFPSTCNPSVPLDFVVREFK